MEGSGIPDPFQPIRKYKKKYVFYDRSAREWWMNCGCCDEKLYAPSRKTLVRTRLYHTRNICLGGY